MKCVTGGPKTRHNLTNSARKQTNMLNITDTDFMFDKPITITIFSIIPIDQLNIRS